MKNDKVIKLKAGSKEPDRQSGSKKKNQPLKWPSVPIVTVIYWFVISLLLTPSFHSTTPVVNKGEISKRNIRAPQDFLTEDTFTTEKNRFEAKKNAPDIYDLDIALFNSLKKRVEDAFNTITNYYKENGQHLLQLFEDEDTEGRNFASGKKDRAELKNFENSREFIQKEAMFKKIIGIDLNDEMMKTLKSHHYKDKIKEDILSILKYMLTSGVVQNKGEKTDERSIILREVGTDRERNLKNMDSVIEVKELPFLIKQLTVEKISKEDRALQNVVETIIGELVKANLTFNKEATEQFKRSLVLAQKPVFFSVKKGEMIVREGEPVTAEHLMKIESLNSLRLSHNFWMKVFGIAFFVALFIWLFWNYLKRFNCDIANDTQGLILFGLILVISLTVARFTVFAVDSYSGFGVEQEYLYFLIPFATGPLLISILFATDLTIIFSVINALLIGFMIENSFSYVVVAFAGGLVAVSRVKQYRKRSAILRTGVLVGVVNMVTIFPICLIENTLLTEKSIFALSGGFLSGMIAAAVVSVLLPFIESLFHFTSDLKLLELSDLNHPLLSALAVNAPGTYHHSIMLGNLAEKAAEAVGANPLLCRVASYYHDIGKIKKPEYFIENQRVNTNPHDSLSPSMSSLIIASHVKEGVELAKEYRLVSRIQNIIAEHHGTSLITFFYHKAKKSENTSIQSVCEEGYRYSGPKPKTKEAAIILLADAVEAASRSLDNPTHSRLKGIVKMILEEKIVDGQLDNSHLSFNDLHLISESFLRILPGIFHSRIEYPKAEKSKAEHGDIDSKRSKEGENRVEPDKRKDPKDLRSVRGLRF